MSPACCPASNSFSHAGAPRTCFPTKIAFVRPIFPGKFLAMTFQWRGLISQRISGNPGLAKPHPVRFFFASDLVPECMFCPQDFLCETLFSRKFLERETQTEYLFSKRIARNFHPSQTSVRPCQVSLLGRPQVLALRLVCRRPSRPDRTSHMGSNHNRR